MAIYNDYGKIWWHDITGPHTLVSKIISAIEDEKSVLLIVPFDLPWRKEMREEFQLSFSNQTPNGESFFYEIDVSDKCADIDPGRFLLEESNLPQQIKYGYRSNSKISIQELLIRHGALRNQIYWIKGLDNITAEKWIDFSRNYKSSKDNGIFVIELPEEYLNNDAEIESLCMNNYREYVTGYDARLMDHMVLQQVCTIPQTLYSYIAALVYNLCDFDVEVASDLLNIFEWENDDYFSVLRALSEKSEYIKRGSGQNKDHIFSLIRNNKIDDIRQKIWTAQIQSFLPVIEMERKMIIDIYYDNIKESLQKNSIMQFHKRITDPWEVEVGTLYYMISTRKDISSYILYLPNEETRNRIEFLREFRNTLAHLQTCGIAEIKKLLRIL